MIQNILDDNDANDLYLQAKHSYKISQANNKPLTKKLMNENFQDQIAVQYNVERKRPVYAVPQSKKRSISQGKPFNLVTKYYDENYILEDDKEDAKDDEFINLRVSKRLSNDEEEKNM